MAWCRREIADIEDQLRAGRPEVEGLCLALRDWSGELRMIERELEAAEQNPVVGKE